MSIHTTNTTDNTSIESYEWSRSIPTITIPDYDNEQCEICKKECHMLDDYSTVIYVQGLPKYLCKECVKKYFKKVLVALEL